MKKIFFFFSALALTFVSNAQTITIDNQTYTDQQLVEEVLVIACTPITNVHASGDTAIKSWGYFHRDLGSPFPFEEGVYLTTGSSNQIVDPNYASGVGAPIMSYGTTAWGSDTDIEAELGATNMINATVLEFDFIPTVTNIAFDYIMLSEEYHGDFPCNYADGFAFLIKPVGAPTYNNIAVIPATATPVAVTTVHPALSDSGVALSCAASNAGYFDGYYPLDTNFNGRTTVLTASTSVIPNQQYHIKLVVADATGNANPDTSFDTAIFLKARGLNLGVVTVDAGPDINICEGDPNPILDATVANATAQYQWQVYDVVNNVFVDIAGATNATYEVTTTGSYQILLDVDGCLSDDHVNVVFSEVPVSTQPNNLEVCDANADGFVVANLTVQNLAILNGQDPATFNVNYYEDAALTIPINNPSFYANSTAYQQPIYAQVVNTFNNNCASNVVSFDLLIYDAPDPLPLPNLVVCDNNANGIETFDMSGVQNTNLLNGLNAADFVITYYEDVALTTVIADPANYSNTSSPYNQTIYVTIANVNNAACTITLNFDLVVSNNLDIGSPGPLRECDDDGDGFWIFDLTVQDTIIMAGLDTNLYTLTYYEDAALTIPIADSTAHQNNPVDVQTIYAQVVNNANPNCNATIQFDIEVYIIPAATSPPDLDACDTNNDGFTLFDLTVNDNAVLNGQAVADFTVLYYLDAALTQQIPNPATYTNVIAYNQTIYVVVGNTDLSTCQSSGVSFDLNVYDVPQPIPALDDLRSCDFSANGIANFDLTVQDITILNGQNPVNFTINYYEDAALTIQIAVPTNYDNTVPNLQTIYVEILNNSNAACSSTAQFNLVVDNAPPIVQPNNILICDDNNDGLWVFDLTTQEMIILNGLSSADYSITYYENATLTTQIATPTAYTNTSSPSQTVYIKVENNTFAACQNTTTIGLQVADTPTATQAQNMITCDTDNLAGIGNGVFDLTTQDVAILNGQAAADFTVNYYVNSIHTVLVNTPTAYINTSGGTPQIIYVQVSNNINNICTAETTFTLQTFDTPTPPTVIPPFKNCDDNNDGFQTVNLTDFDSVLLNGQNPADIQISYFLDAALTTPVADPTAFTNTTATSQTLYASLINVNNTACNISVPFDVEIYDTPTSGQANDIYLCNDGRSASFDMSVQLTDILNGQAGMNVGFYGSQVDADAATNPLANPFIATVNAGPFTVFVRVENQGYTVCADTSTTFTIEAFEAPTPPTTITPIEVCDDNNDSYFTFDLPALKDAEILNGQNAADFTIRYYTDAALVNEIITPNTFTNTVATTQRIWTKMSNNNYTGCDETRFFDLMIYDFAAATQPVNMEQCDNDTIIGVGTSVFDLTTKEPAILNGQDPAIFDIRYYTDAALTVEVLNPTNYTNTTGAVAETIYIQVYNTLYNVCTATTDFTIQTFDSPIPPATIAVVEVCDDNNDGFFTFDLPALKDAEMLNGQSAADFTIRYYTDAALTNEIMVPNVFTNTVVVTQTIWITMTNNSLSACTEIRNFDLKIYDFAAATQPVNMEQCDNDTTVGVGTSVFDLTVQEPAILNGQDPAIFDIKYFTDAALTNEILNPTNYTNTTGAVSETIYILVYNTLYDVCTASTDFTIQTFDSPNFPATITPLVYCDDDTDGIHVTDLTQKELELLNGYASTDFEVHYYTDAALTNEIINPITYTNTTANAETIYVKVLNSLFNTCEAIGSFELQINSTPTVVSYSDMICDVDGVYDNYTAIDLTQYETDMGIGVIDLNYYYYIDAAFTNQIVNPVNFVNTHFTQIIYVQVENATTLCMTDTTITVTVSSADAADALLSTCDDLTEDGLTTFDLTQADAAILVNMPAGAHITLKRYLTYDDALNQINEYTASTYTNIVNPQDIYIRVDNIDNPDCFDIATLTLEVYTDVVLESIYYLCLDEGSVTVEAADYYATYGWFNGDDLILGNAHEHTFTTAGNYYLVVTNANGCMKRTDFVVEISESPEIIDIAVVDLSEDNMLTVVAIGAVSGDPLAASHFEYALDDGPYQMSNIFHNVHGGWRLLRVRDIHGCGEVTQRVMVLDYPKFFTPNNDGFND